MRDVRFVVKNTDCMSDAPPTQSDMGARIESVLFCCPLPSTVWCSDQHRRDSMLPGCPDPYFECTMRQHAAQPSALSCDIHVSSNAVCCCWLLCLPGRRHRGLYFFLLHPHGKCTKPSTVAADIVICPYCLRDIIALNVRVRIRQYQSLHETHLACNTLQMGQHSSSLVAAKNTTKKDTQQGPVDSQ